MRSTSSGSSPLVSFSKVIGGQPSLNRISPLHHFAAAGAGDSAPARARSASTAAA
jgi:hypothetical protein